jgi:hypothetical protein
MERSVNPKFAAFKRLSEFGRENASQVNANPAAGGTAFNWMGADLKMYSSMALDEPELQRICAGPPATGVQVGDKSELVTKVRGI